MIPYQPVQRTNSTGGKLNGSDIVKSSIDGQQGIYIAFPTSAVLKSIYRPKNYKTTVNDRHTKVGIAKDSFASRRRGYVGNFDGEVEFIPVVTVSADQLAKAEHHILQAMRQEFSTVGRAREWFDTAERQRVIDVVIATLDACRFDYERIA